MTAIAIVTTGGTIDKDYFDALSEYKVVESPVADLLHSYHLNLEFELFPLFRKDSLELTDDDRKQIKSKIAELPYSKILVTHGTDTMVQTAQAIGNIAGKTIVLTGAMKPARFKETDAIFNIGFAIGSLQALESGTHVCMSGHIFDPEKVHKNREAGRFESD